MTSIFIKAKVCSIIICVCVYLLLFHAITTEPIRTKIFKCLPILLLYFSRALPKLGKYFSPYLIFHLKLGYAFKASLVFFPSRPSHDGTIRVSSQTDGQHLTVVFFKQLFIFRRF